MSKVRRSAIDRAAEELQAEHPDTIIQDGVASFLAEFMRQTRRIYASEFMRQTGLVL